MPKEHSKGVIYTENASSVLLNASHQLLAEYIAAHRHSAEQEVQVTISTAVKRYH